MAPRSPQYGPRTITLRKSYDTLAHPVKSELGQNPVSGAMFLFVNRACTRAKVLWWDGTGLCILHKPLEGGPRQALQ